MSIGTELRRINLAFMLHGLANWLAAGRIPQPHRVIGVAAGILLFFGAMVFFLMKRKKKVAVIEEPIAAVTPHSVAVSAAAEEVQQEVAVAAQKIVVFDDPRKEQLSQIARDYHDATVRVIRMWLQEDPSKVRSPLSNGNGTEAIQ